eukprot:370321_1
MIIFCILRYVYCKLYRLYFNIPPGPEGLPLLQNFLDITMFNPTTWHFNIANYYGPIASYSMFGQENILINDPSIAKEVLSKCLDRDTNFIKKDRYVPFSAKDNTPPFSFISGNKWSKRRKLMHSKLIRVLDTKFVNRIMNDFIKNEFESELNKIILNNNGIWYSRELLTYLAFNTIFECNFGKRIDIKHTETYKELANDLHLSVSISFIFRGIILNLVGKTIRNIFSSYFDILYNLRNKTHNNILSMINKRKQEVNNYNEDEMTFIDWGSKLEENNEISISEQIADIYLMFVAGTDTTAATSECGLIYLAKQPEIQYKVRNELLTVFKRNNIDYSNPSNILYDIHLLLQLPLFRALIYEILRISSIFKIGGAAHRNLAKDIWIKTKDNKKYRIRKDADIWYNVHYIHSNYFSNNNDSETIVLEHWLKMNSSKQYKFYKNQSFIGFGSGKRDCPGRELAQKELRIIFGYLLLNYDISIPQNYKNQNIKWGWIYAGPSKPNPQIPIHIQKI